LRLPRSCRKKSCSSWPAAALSTPDRTATR
jgi:hypothetical protein